MSIYTNINALKLSRIGKISHRLGYSKKSTLFWSWYNKKNFGDWISPFLYKEKTGNLPIYNTPKYTRFPNKVIFGAGSILRHIKKEDVAVVWGSGIIHHDTTFARPKEILAVRGHYTLERCQKLNYNALTILGDPGILLPLFYKPSQKKENVQIGIIPHFVNYNEACEMFKKRNDVKVIDVTKNITDVIDDICKCKSTLSSSLHGIIVSHAYGIPSSQITFSNELMGDGVKFLDYYSSIQNEAPLVAETIFAEMPIDELQNISTRSKVPNLHDLQQGLMKTMPF